VISAVSWSKRSRPRSATSVDEWKMVRELEVCVLGGSLGLDMVVAGGVLVREMDVEVLGLFASVCCGDLFLRVLLV
jgi:hypothetical protein